MPLPSKIYLPGGKALVKLDGSGAIVGVHANAADCCCGDPCTTCTGMNLTAHMHITWTDGSCSICPSGGRPVDIDFTTQDMGYVGGCCYWNYTYEATLCGGVLWSIGAYVLWDPGTRKWYAGAVIGPVVVPPVPDDYWDYFGSQASGLPGSPSPCTNGYAYDEVHPTCVDGRLTLTVELPFNTALPQIPGCDVTSVTITLA